MICHATVGQRDNTWNTRQHRDTRTNTEADGPAKASISRVPTAEETMLARPNNRKQLVIPPGAGARRGWCAFVGVVQILKSVAQRWRTSTEKDGKVCAKPNPLETDEWSITEAPHPHWTLDCRRRWRQVQQQHTSCCSHSFASWRGVRKYPSVEGRKSAARTPIRVAARRRRETVRRTACGGGPSSASCCLREPSERWHTQLVWSCRKLKRHHRQTLSK